MNIIIPNTNPVTLSILPRRYDPSVAVSILFKNEDTNKQTTIVSSNSRYISNELALDIDATNFAEGQRFTFEVLQGVNIVFRGKAFVTTQNDTNYTINNNEFVVNTDTDSDEMKVYE